VRDDGGSGSDDVDSLVDIGDSQADSEPLYVSDESLYTRVPYRAAEISADPPQSPQSLEAGGGAVLTRPTRSIDFGKYEGYVSVFGMKPHELFARADEISYPNLMPIIVDVTPNLLEPEPMKKDDEMEEDEPHSTMPNYGLRGLQAQIARYEIVPRAEAWFDDQLESPLHVPRRNDAIIEYWELNKGWESLGKEEHPTLYQTKTAMPRWSQEGLRAFGRSLPPIGSCAWLENDTPTESASWRDRRKPCWIVKHLPFKDEDKYRVTIDLNKKLSNTMAIGRKGTLTCDVGILKKTMVERDEVDRITKIDGSYVHIVTRNNEHKRLRIFDAPLKQNTRRATLEIYRVNGSIKFELKIPISQVTRDEDDPEPEFYVVKEANKDDIVVANFPTEVKNVRSKHVDYTPKHYYYEKNQLRLLYPQRLAEYKQNEGGHWMNVFYGGRDRRSAQSFAAKNPQVQVGGIRDVDMNISGFAIEMARHIIKDAFSREGKTLWLLHEAHGLALVNHFLESGKVEDKIRSRIKVFGSYVNSEKVVVQREVKAYLETKFNHEKNINGDICKLFIGGAGDLGVGVTFTEVRHIYLDLTSSYFSILQQMGRGERLCKHARLNPQDRTLTFHLPYPLMTLGWGAKAHDATAQKSPGGIGFVTTSMPDYVSMYKIGTRSETIDAHLHVPVHAFDALNSLQRSRVQFYTGMQLFDRVAMDTAYYLAEANWKPNTVDLTKEPYDKKKVASMVRLLVRNSVPQHMYDAGFAKLKKESSDNAKLNHDAMKEGVPDEDERKRRSINNEPRIRYITEVISAMKKEEIKGSTERNRVQNQQDTADFIITGIGTVSLKGHPGDEVNQKQAIKLITQGHKNGDKHCNGLYGLLRMYDKVR
jgi:hypothetical protein